MNDRLELDRFQTGGVLLKKDIKEDLSTVFTLSRSADVKRGTSVPIKDLVRLAVHAILSKKGRDILVLDVHAVSGFADVFIVATGDSDLQIRAIVDAIKQSIKDETGERVWHTEGYDHLQWVLLDYVDLVVHVFSEEKRSYYGLERLWGDASRVVIPDDADSDSIAFLIHHPESE